MASLDLLRKERLAKAETLRQRGINPYPSKSFRTHSIKEIVQNPENFLEEIAVAGRLMSMRAHGGVTFSDMTDESESIQLYLKEDTLTSTDAKTQSIGFADLNLLDIGDIIEARGKIMRTKRGELSLEATHLRMLAKSIRPLPNKHDGLKDPELIFRKRYLDLVINPEQKELFKRKALFWQAHRDFMAMHGFIEMQIPVLELVTGGADAKPFTTYHNALDQDYFLRISLELNLKRLIGGGFEKVYALGPVFRNEGIDDEHLQEFYAIEWYWAYADYRDNMKLSQECFRYIADKVYGRTVFTREGHTFDLASDWPEIDYTEAIKSKLGIDIWSDGEEKMREVIERYGAELNKGLINRNRLVDNLWKIVRKTISGPAFLVNEPAFMSPLAKSHTDNSKLTERFHIILAGSEMANAYSELNDPVDQLNRFKEQQRARDAGDLESQMLDIDFVEMLEYGMPPVSGYGHSERLFAFFENLSVREATLFPQMRAKTDDTTREIYGL